DEELVYIHKPGVSIHGRSPGDVATMWHIKDPELLPCDVQIDQLGFRNSHEIEQADIAVLGDSFVEGLQTPEPELITTQLQKLTGMTKINLGQCGYGPEQELIVLRRFALPRKPKWCVWLFYEGNDLSDVSLFAAQKKNLAAGFYRIRRSERSLCY